MRETPRLAPSSANPASVTRPSLDEAAASMHWTCANPFSATLRESASNWRGSGSSATTDPDGPTAGAATSVK
jgi:hypothetical protein